MQIALSTDLLMGFCGESEADHQETLDLIQRVGYDQAFLFAYSERSQTHAARHLQVPIGFLDSYICIHEDKGPSAMGVTAQVPISSAGQNTQSCPY